MAMDISLSTLTEVTEYMEKRIGKFADVLGWTDFTSANSPVYEAAIDAVLAMGADDIGDVTDYKGLRASAEYFLWLEVANNSGAFYDFKSEGASFSRKQLQEQALKNLEQAREKAIARGVEIEGGAEGAEEIVVLGLDWDDF